MGRPHLVPLLSRVDVPVYLGCDWENVPMHLPGTFDAWDALADNPNVRMALLGAHGLPGRGRACTSRPWPGSTTGSRAATPGSSTVRRSATWLPGTDGWRTAEEWPPRPILVALALGGDGGLVTGHRRGTRHASVGLTAHLRHPPTRRLRWTSEPLPPTSTSSGTAS